MRLGLVCAAGALLLSLPGCGGSSGAGAPQTSLGTPRYNAGGVPRGVKVGKPYIVKGVTYTPHLNWGYDETGIASWYGDDFHGRPTANGEEFDMDQVSAAHKTLPLPSLVRITNLDNGRTMTVRINDRGPFGKGRIIDLSKRGAQMLGFYRAGLANVRVQVLEAETRAMWRNEGAQPPEQPAPRPGEPEILTASLNQRELSRMRVDLPPAPRPGASYEATMASSGRTRPVAMNVAPVVSPAVPATMPGKTPPRLRPSVPLPPPTSQAAPQTAPRAAPMDRDALTAMIAAAHNDANLEQLNALGASAPPLGPASALGMDGGGLTVTTPPSGFAHDVEAVPAFVEAGAFRTQAEAAAAADHMGGLGPVGISAVNFGNRTIYALRVGPLPGFEAADQVKQALVAGGLPDARVVP